MANKSEVTIKFKDGKNEYSFNATYYNWVVKEEKKVIAKAPNGNVVSEKVVDEASINISETKAKKAEITKKWMDESGNIYPKDDIKFYDWEGKQLAENLKTLVFESDNEGIFGIDAFLDTYATEGYYRVEAKEEKDQNILYELSKLLNGFVVVGELNLTSRGFSKSYAGLRFLNDGSCEFMTFKNKKAIQYNEGV